MNKIFTKIETGDLLVCTSSHSRKDYEAAYEDT